VINGLGTNSAALLRLLPNGTPDGAFGASGMYTQFSSNTNQFYSFTPLLKGSKVLLTGVDNSIFGDRLLCYLQVFNDVNVNVQSNADAESFKLWPNPSSELLTIGADGTMEFRSVEVFDLSGARVISLRGNLRAPLSIDLRPLSSGPYILQVEGPGGRVSQSFLKN
jgi:hypothetical protein